MENIENLVQFQGTKASLSRPLTKSLKGFDDWLKANQGNRDGTLAELKEALKRWFTQGVLYERQPAATVLFDVSCYTNEPKELGSILDVTQGKITASILRRKRIPEYIWPELLIIAPAVPLGGKREIKASFNIRPLGPPFATVFQTEGQRPEARAEIVAIKWYILTALYIWKYVSEAYQRGDFKRHETFKEVTDYLELEQKLRILNLNQTKRVEYYTRRLGYEFQEVSEMMRNLGTQKHPEAIRKSYDRLSKNLKVKQY